MFFLLTRSVSLVAVSLGRVESSRPGVPGFPPSWFASPCTRTSLKAWTRGQTDPLTSVRSCKHAHPHSQSAGRNSALLSSRTHSTQLRSVTFLSELELASHFGSPVASGGRFVIRRDPEAYLNQAARHRLTALASIG